jgi:hypothetical protein
MKRVFRNLLFGVLLGLLMRVAPNDTAITIQLRKPSRRG